MQFTTYDNRVIQLEEGEHDYAVVDANDRFAETPSGREINQTFTDRKEAVAYFNRLKRALTS
jgi:hypothetical protein